MAKAAKPAKKPKKAKLPDYNTSIQVKTKPDELLNVLLNTPIKNSKINNK